MDMQMFFSVVKMVRPDTRAGCSDIKTKLETMKMSQFKHDIYKSNPQISEYMNDISKAEESYSGIFRQKIKLYSASSCPPFEEYMDYRRSE